MSSGFAIVRMKIRGTYFERRFSYLGSAAFFRNLKESAQDISTRLQTAETLHNQPSCKTFKENICDMAIKIDLLIYVCLKELMNV